jgi:hypothetical protein
MEMPDKITCVDCGQDAHLISYPPEEGWQVGDYVAYRCRGCNDRWDLVVEDGDSSQPDGFDFRKWLDERDSKK